MSQCALFSPAEIDSLRAGGRILRSCLEHATALARPGVRTKDIDAAAEAFIRERGGLPAFKGYRGFPGTLCISVNEQCVHGIPGTRTLDEGDIVSLDCGVIFDGLYTDACVTVPVGEIMPEAQRLIDVTEAALAAALQALHAGVHVGDLSATIQAVIEEGGFRAIAALTGHGVGRAVHDFPDIPNVGTPGTGPVLPAGTVIAIEPIVSAGSGDVHDIGDGWTLAEVDGSLTSHAEHTVVVTEGGCSVLA